MLFSSLSWTENHLLSIIVSEFKSVSDDILKSASFHIVPADVLSDSQSERLTKAYVPSADAVIGMRMPSMGLNV